MQEWQKDDLQQCWLLGRVFQRVICHCCLLLINKIKHSRSHRLSEILPCFGNWDIPIMNLARAQDSILLDTVQQFSVVDKGMTFKSRFYQLHTTFLISLSLPFFIWIMGALTSPDSESCNVDSQETVC